MVAPQTTLSRAVVLLAMLHQGVGNPSLLIVRKWGSLGEMTTVVSREIQQQERNRGSQGWRMGVMPSPIGWNRLVASVLSIEPLVNWRHVPLTVVLGGNVFLTRRNSLKVIEHASWWNLLTSINWSTEFLSVGVEGMEPASGNPRTHASKIWCGISSPTSIVPQRLSMTSSSRRGWTSGGIPSLQMKTTIEIIWMVGGVNLPGRNTNSSCSGLLGVKWI